MGVFDGREFLGAARQLSLHKNREDCARSAISRAYYACYWVGRAYCLAHGVQVKPPRKYRYGVHKYLQDQFADLGALKISSELFRLCDRRAHADYSARYPEYMDRAADDMILDAERLIALIDALE